MPNRQNKTAGLRPDAFQTVPTQLTLCVTYSFKLSAATMVVILPVLIDMVKRVMNPEATALHQPSRPPLPAPAPDVAYWPRH